MNSRILNSVFVFKLRFQFNATIIFHFFQVLGGGVVDDKPEPKMRKRFDNGFIAEVIMRLLLLGVFL